MLEPTTTITDYISVTTINDLPDELLRHISILGGPTEYCNFRRAMKRVWLSTTGREDHCVKYFLVTKISEAGDTVTTLCDEYHSMFDQPAYISSGGTKTWRQHGKRHRDNDLPAVIYSDGTKAWYQYGKQHRDNDLPAAVRPDGTQLWWKRGELHRDNDRPAWVAGSGGKQIWYQHGEYHRDKDLPAYIDFYGANFWYQRGKLHRDNDLPAIVWANGTKYWFKHGVFVNERCTL